MNNEQYIEHIEQRRDDYKEELKLNLDHENTILKNYPHDRHMIKEAIDYSLKLIRYERESISEQIHSCEFMIERTKRRMK